MYKPFKNIPNPERDTQIWRYMSMDKFLDLILNRSLYFSRLDRLGDPYEGAPTITELQEMAKYFDGLSSSPPDKNMLPIEEVMASMGGQKFALMRISMFANCWHANPNEDMAMWRMYGSAGVAIRTSFGKLVDTFSLPETPDIFAGMVAYSDSFPFDPNRPSSLVESALRKRQSFQSERELRALIVNVPYLPVGEIDDNYPDVEGRPHPRGISIDIDPSALIDEVFVSPVYPDRVRSIVESVMKNQTLMKPVVHSKLLADPEWVKPVRPTPNAPPRESNTGNER